MLLVNADHDERHQEAISLVLAFKPTLVLFVTRCISFGESVETMGGRDRRWPLASRSAFQTVFRRNE